MRQIFSATTFLSFLFVVPIAALADPGPTIKYLMNEPANMLEFGLLKLQYEMDKLYKDEKISPTASYDWDKNQLVIQVGEWGASAEDATKENCRGWIERLRGDFGIDPKTGAVDPVLGKASFVGTHFRPDGYARKDEPADMGQRLDQIVLLKAVFTITTTHPSSQVKCQGPLLGSEVMFSE